MKTDIKAVRIHRNVLRHVLQNRALYTSDDIRRARVNLNVATFVHQHPELYPSK